ncbi:uncharacterized protein LOC103030033 isoform X1 [Astyanax mexicanus]|uniref:uncharacterized protein LOC103030033 isoform X1 n=1 Tax=Astyanax mexicanus TaxID=7994 RepID=UPI0020CB4EFA|nr:uncharacterized protein LOC103030033 isoform X1 [Astyanax mexicanus]
MRVEQLPAPSNNLTPTIQRNPGTALLSGAMNGSINPAAAAKEPKNDDLPVKKAFTAETPKLPTTAPIKKKTLQPNCRETQPRPSSLPSAGRDTQKKMTKAKWLWKFSRWRRLHRSLWDPQSLRPPKLTPDATTVQSRQREKADASANKNSLARSIRSMQLLTSTSESSPSPPSSKGKRCKAVHVYRTRRYRNQLLWYRILQHEKRLRAQRLAQQSIKTPSSADSSVRKGTSEYLDKPGLKYQREERKRSLPSARSFLVRKMSRRTKRKLWRRQLDSSSSDSPVSGSSASATPVCAHCMSSRGLGTRSCPTLTSDSFTSLKDTPSTNMKSALASPGQRCADKKRVTFSDFQEGPLFSHMQKTTKSPRPLKEVKFKDSPSAIQISETPSRSKSAVQKMRLPSTPHVCKKRSKSSTRRSATPKHKVQAKSISSIDLSLKGNSQSDTSKSPSKVSSSQCLASQMNHSQKFILQVTPSPKDPHQRKKKKKHGQNKPTSNTPAETTARMQAHPQAQFKTPSPRTSNIQPEYPLPSKAASSSTFKRPISARQGNLKIGHNCTRSTQTPFRRPDTPRPKSCPEFLKWKKVLELRDKMTRPTSRSLCSFQGHSSEEYADILPSPRQMFSDSSSLSIQFTQKHGHSSRPALDRENSSQRLEQSHHGKAAVLNKRMESQHLSTSSPSITLQIAQEQRSGSSSPELSQAILSAMRLFLSKQPAEAESTSFNSPCHPSPSPDTSASGGDARQRPVSQRTSLSGCQYFAVSIKPLELSPPLPFLSQDTCRPVEHRGPFWLVQEGGDNHTQSSPEQTLTEREINGQAAEPDAKKADKIKSASKSKRHTI